MAILRRLWQGRNDIYFRANATIHFSADRLKTKDFRGPDLFVVKNPKQRGPGDRNSWVVWEEDGRYPRPHHRVAIPEDRQQRPGRKKRHLRKHFQNT